MAAPSPVEFGAQSGTAFTSYNPVYVDGIDLPAGRAMGNGAVSAAVSALNVGVNGNGAARSFTCTLGSASASFSVGAGGTAPGYAGWSGVSSLWLVNGGTARFGVSASGSFHFSHGGPSGTTYDGSGAAYSGALLGGYEYVLPPTAPTIGVVSSPALGEATVAFTASSDDGGAAISTYRVEYSTDDFATIAGYVESTSSPVTISGLTPGVVYYFRVAARNAVTDAAGTVGAYSSIASVSIIGGIKVGKSGAWVMCAAYVGVNGVWVPAEVFAGRSGNWVGLTT